MKKTIIILIAVLFSITLTGCSCSKKKENKKEEPKIEANVNEGVIQDQTVEEISFKNTSMIIENNQTKFTTTVTNNGTKDRMINRFKISVYDEQEQQIATLTGYVGGILRAGETKTIVNYTDIDLLSAKKIVYKIQE